MLSLSLDPLLQDLGGLVAGEAVGACARRLNASLRRLAGLIETAADDLLAAPHDLHPGRPDEAIEIYAGSFRFAGHTVETRGRSVFAVASPARDWCRELNGFEWLRHLAAADMPVSRLNARALVDDWLALDAVDNLPRLAWDAETAARRLISWLTHAPLYLDRADTAFRSRLLASITRHVGRLTRFVPQDSGTLAGIRVAAALLAAAIAVPAFRRQQAAAMRRLDAELKRQVLIDGGHASRNPAAIAEVLAEILPLRDALAGLGRPASPTMMNSIDRMMPMLRFFRLGETGLARFHGVGAVDEALIAAVLAADDAGGTAHGNASHSGYQRLQSGTTALVVDCGPPPPPALAREAHASCLAFEFASGANRFVVNCGHAAAHLPDWQAAGRATAAHSTVTVAETSSAHVIERGILAGLIGRTVVGGPRQVPVERREHAGSVAVTAHHDGYARRFGLVHERTLRLEAGGRRIDGRDRLEAVRRDDDPVLRRPVAPHPYHVRFHLDPAIRAHGLDSGVVMLMAPDGEAWEFRADDCRPRVEESIYLADPAGPCRTEQIVLEASADAEPEQRWSFTRLR
ncbi:MAG: heparinase II/III family protein [Ancalomicrobiaceae bacterium]|nr:heparinase II/III family protein [Ancalomicrobiaceae bacterium]